MSLAQFQEHGGPYAKLAQALWNTSSYWWDVTNAPTLDDVFALANDWALNEDAGALNSDQYGMPQLIKEIRQEQPDETQAMDQLRAALTGLFSWTGETSGDRYTDIKTIGEYDFDERFYPAAHDGEQWWMAYDVYDGVWCYKSSSIRPDANDSAGWRAQAPRSLIVTGIAEQGAGWWYGLDQSGCWRYAKSVTRPTGAEDSTYWLSAEGYQAVTGVGRGEFLTGGETYFSPEETHEEADRTDLDLLRKEAAADIAAELHAGLAAVGYAPLPSLADLMVASEVLLQEAQRA